MLYERYQYIVEIYSINCIDKHLQIQILQGPGCLNELGSRIT